MPTLPGPRSRRRNVARRIVTIVSSALALVTIFALAIVVGILGHIDTPVARRLVASQATSILRGLLAGEVIVEHIGGIGLNGLDGVRVRIRDPQGVQVLFIDGVRVRVHGLDAARSALLGKGDIAIDVPDASIGHVDANIDVDPAGNLRIANAFALRNPSPPSEPKPNARGVRVEAPVVRLHHAWVHGRPADIPSLDAEFRSLTARGHYDPKLVRADLEHVDVVARGLPRSADPKGRFGGQFLMPSATGKDYGVTAAFDGTLAGVPTTLRGKMDGKEIEATVDARDASGENLRATFEEVGVREQVVLHAEAKGELPHVVGKVHFAVGDGTVDVDADVDAGEPLKAKAKVVARKIDLRAVVPSLPSSDLGLDANGEMTLPKGGTPWGTLSVDTIPGTIAGEAAPAVELRADASGGGAHAVGRILDARAPTSFNASMTPEGKGSVVTGELDSTVPDLSRLPKVVGDVRGHANVHVAGTMHLPSKAVDATVQLEGSDLAYGPHGVDDVRLLATGKGSVDAPVVDVGLHAEGLRSGDIRVPSSDVRGRVALSGKTVTVTDAHVDVAREAISASVYASKIEIGGPRMHIEGATITGAGEPIRADVTREPREIIAKIDAPAIDLARLAAIAGRDDVRTGRMTMKADVVLHPTDARGELHVAVEDFSAAKVENARAAIDATFEDRRIGLDLDAEVARAGHVSLHATKLGVSGDPTALKSWKGVSGRVKLEGTVDMARVSSLLPEGTVPADVRGWLIVAGTLARDDDKAPPEIRLNLHTRDLDVATRPESQVEAGGVEVKGVAPFHSSGVDVAADVRIDGTSGDGQVAFRLTDKHGALVAFDAKSNLPYADILAMPPDLLDKLKQAPVNARLIVPQRTLDWLPPSIGLRNYAGTVSADLDVSGTILQPQVELRARALGVREVFVPIANASDTVVSLSYDGTKADVSVDTQGQGRHLLQVASHVEVAIGDLMAPKPGKELPWKGDARAKLDRFPIGNIGVIADRRIRGNVSGEVVLENLHEDAHMQARLALDTFKIGRAEYPNGKIEIDAANGKVTAALKLEQPDGFADLSGNAGLTWGHELVPTLDTAQPVEGRLSARAFRAAAILPFVQSFLNDLDGRIDADATFALDPRSRSTQMGGKVTYREGTLQVAAIGDELHDARASVTLQPDGTIRIDDIEASGTNGKVSADAVVKMKGLTFEGATANAKIAEKGPLDLILQGQPLGEVWGEAHVKAAASPDGSKLSLNVDVPKVHAKLAQSLKTGVQDLSRNENVRVGVFSGPSTFVQLGLDRGDLRTAAEEDEEKKAATVIDIDIALGEAVVVRGNQIDVVFGGHPHVTLDGDTRMSGQIELRRGKVDVQGKEFTVDRGTITFQPDDVSNPIVVATASWEAGDGTKVFADFVGPVKSGKMTLRSEPTRPKNEILALVLFGSADGMNAVPQQGRAPDGTTRAAVSVGGGIAAQGLSEALDDLAGIHATARIDTTQSNNPRPEVQIQISQAVSVQFAHVLGTPPITEPDRNLATIDWRFRRNWSLETTVGDRGKATIDAVWQKRY